MPVLLKIGDISIEKISNPALESVTQNIHLII